MVTITLPLNLEKAVTEEAARKGTTAELLTLDVLEQRFLSQPSKRLSDGKTLADARGDYTGAVDSGDKHPNGSSLSENTGRKFGELMAEKHKRGAL